ncbi:hypothetical protein ACQZ6V_13900 [Agrobacterium sp. 22-3674b3]
MLIIIDYMHVALSQFVTELDALASTTRKRRKASPMMLPWTINNQGDS